MITKIRASKVTIEIPKEGSIPWIHITVQQVLRHDDGTLENIIPRFDYLSYPLNEVGETIYPYQDPFFPPENQISGYGIAGAMTSLVITLLIKEYGGSVNSDGDIIL